MNQKNSFTVIVVLALIIGFLGGYWSYSVIKGSSTSKCPSEQEIKKDFVKELRNKNVIPELPDKIDMAKGTINKVNDKEITINTVPLLSDPLRKHLLSDLTVEITKDTRLVRLVEKKIEENKNSGSSVPSPETEYSEKIIKPSALEPGQKVEVYSDQGFGGKSHFKAQRIKVLTE